MTQHNTSEGDAQDQWQYQVRCETFPLLLTIGITVGIFFAVCIGLLVAAVVIINVNDYREYKRFEAEKRVAIGEMEKHDNPTYHSPVQMNENPAHGM